MIALATLNEIIASELEVRLFCSNASSSQSTDLRHSIVGFYRNVR